MAHWKYVSIETVLRTLKIDFFTFKEMVQDGKIEMKSDIKDRIFAEIITTSSFNKCTQSYAQKQQMQPTVTPSKITDELINSVKSWAKQQESISVGFVQRTFKIGYNKASILIEILERDGILKAGHDKYKEVIK